MASLASAFLSPFLHEASGDHAAAEAPDPLHFLHSMEVHFSAGRAKTIGLKGFLGFWMLFPFLWHTRRKNILHGPRIQMKPLVALYNTLFSIR